MRKSILFILVFTVCFSCAIFGQKQTSRKESNTIRQNDQENANQAATSTEIPKPEQSPIEQPNPTESNQQQNETNWNKWSAIGTIASAITGIVVFILVLIQARISYDALRQMQRQIEIMDTQNKEVVRQNEIMDIQTATMSKQLDVMANQSETMQKQTDAMAKALEQTDIQIEQNAQLLKDSARQVETALRQIELTDRPWIAVDISLASPLTFHEGGASLTFIIKARNIGRSVAVNTTINAQMIAPSSDKLAKAYEEQQRICQRVNSKFMSYAVFPEQDFPLTMTFNIAKQNLEQARFGHNNSINLFIVGCVDYQISGYETHHQTRFIYEVLRLTDKSSVLTLPITLGENVPLQLLALGNTIVGNNDYAD